MPKSINFFPDKITLNSESNALINTLEIHPSYIIFLNPREFYDPIKELKEEREWLIFDIPELTVNRIEYVDISGEIWFSDLLEDTIYCNPEGLRKQYSCVPKCDRNKSHGLTESAIRIIKDEIINYEKLILSNKKAIFAHLQRMRISDFIERSKAEVEQFNNLIKEAETIYDFSLRF